MVFSRHKAAKLDVVVSQGTCHTHFRYYCAPIRSQSLRQRGRVAADVRNSVVTFAFEQANESLGRLKATHLFLLDPDENRLLRDHSLTLFRDSICFTNIRDGCH